MRSCVWLTVLGFAALAGCSSADEKKYTPPDNIARQALETALGHWRDGQPKPEPFTLNKVSVQVLDQVWSSGQKLQGFEFLSEESVGTGPRVYAVKLKTQKGEQTVKYYVVGIDPLWVYSEADYKKQMGG
ncbi:MAG TPA: hypothetical protein VKD90_18130 [Gemmataceae bacterium]|nr:hypothetical protein [Gemmataceae bacterium]